MSRREDLLKQTAESMRKNAARNGMSSAPHHVEGWALQLSNPSWKPLGTQRALGQWILSAKRSNRTQPSEDDLVWLADFAKIVSKGCAGELERPTTDGYYYFWKDKPS